MRFIIIPMLYLHICSLAGQGACGRQTLCAGNEPASNSSSTYVWLWYWCAVCRSHWLTKQQRCRNPTWMMRWPRPFAHTLFEKLCLFALAVSCACPAGGRSRDVYRVRLGWCAGQEPAHAKSELLLFVSAVYRTGQAGYRSRDIDRIRPGWCAGQDPLRMQCLSRFYLRLLCIVQVKQAVDAGTLTESDLDGALARTLRMRFITGQFDPPAANPWASLPISTVNSREHRRLARQVVHKGGCSIVAGGAQWCVVHNGGRTGSKRRQVEKLLLFQIV